MSFKMSGITKVYLSALLVLHWNEASTYRVAVVEYLWDAAIFPVLPPLELGNRNAKIYNEIVQNITVEHGNVDLVVFPEGTLVSEPLDTPEGRKGMSFVPSPDDNVIPCNSSSEKFTSFLKLLSCTAHTYKTYVVVNLKEKDICQRRKCNDSGFIFYNTNVVFDRKGKVVARYRKYNIYLEPDTSRPTEPELITFDTDFGLTFGIFTCFDIIFEAPAIKLVQSGIKNFIFPTLWIPELPFLTTVQVQQMWAQGNDVNLLAAGAAYPRYSSGGAGIYLGQHGVLDKVVTPRTDNYVLFKNVPNESKFKPVCNTKVDDKIATEMDKYSTMYLEDLSAYNYKKLDIKSSKTIEESLCQQNGNKTFCCNFTIELEVKNEKKPSYEYFLLVRSGIRNYGNKTYQSNVEICGLVACSGNSVKDCGQRFSDYKMISWPTSFTKINISAEFSYSKNSMQFPNSLLADFSPISPTCTTWKSATNEESSTVTQSFSTNFPVRKLLTFAIFGRNYALDNSN